MPNVSILKLSWHMKGVAKSSNDAHFGKNIVMIESSMNLVEIEEAC